MIEIERTGNAATIQAAVTDFTSVMGYCEYQLPLIRDGVQVPTPQTAVLGGQAHRAEETKEAEMGELVPVTEEVLADPAAEIEFAREDVHTMLEAGVETSRGRAVVRLVGRTDKVARTGGALHVIDDKFVSRPEQYARRDMPYEGQLLQVLAYLNSSFWTSAGREEEIEIPHERKEWSVRIRDSATSEIVKTFHRVQDEMARAHLFSGIERFARIALGAEEYEHHNNPRKCRPCKYAAVCKFFIDEAAKG